MPVLARPPPSCLKGSARKPSTLLVITLSPVAGITLSGMRGPTSLSVSNIPHSVEVSVASGDRPADVLLVGWDKGQDVCVDFTVTSPLGLDAFPLNLEKARRHLNDAEAAKRAKQLAQCQEAGWGHHPAAYSLWGGQGNLLWEVLKRATADLEGWAKTQRILELRQNLSLALVRGVARQLALRCQVLESNEATLS